MIGPEVRKRHRVKFTRDVPVRIQAIDGTWSRQCSMLDLAEDGAKLLIKESIESLLLKEFFLVSQPQEQHFADASWNGSMATRWAFNF